MSNHYDNLEDAAVVRMFRQGQKDAGSVLVDRYLSTIYVTALRISGNVSDAEDLTQETFVRAFERIEQYNPQFSFRNWLLKIVTNLAISRGIGAEIRNGLGVSSVGGILISGILTLILIPVLYSLLTRRDLYHHHDHDHETRKTKTKLAATSAADSD